MTGTERCICIHGHFYQPPRENPWLEAVETQDSAYPYHDWNQRITAECYEPNAVSRILTADGWIRDIVNNYARISFNFGPTLLSWLEANRPDVYQAIIEADAVSREYYSGHGSAFAQAYNHIILPLANTRDKRTQVRWGIRDFAHRFGRKPAGMWLPETAVDLETLTILAEEGINFTVLAPSQAGLVREIGSEDWQEIGESMETRMPYRVYLPGTDLGLNVFFYDGEVSQAIAFHRLLADGRRFAERLVEKFDRGRSEPQLVHVATDGETYGHHHRHGDMALAFAVDLIQSDGLARLTNYAEYLDLHPPTHEVKIREQTAWSCAHGVDRWRSDCGCNSGARPGWSQQWRGPLRQALDWLRDAVTPFYAAEAGALLGDPWAARDDYVAVILDRSPANVERWLQQHAGRELTPEEQVRALKLLEMQRHAMLMYTSCGWFFDDVAGIETVQILMYAGRVIQLAEELFEEAFEPRFLELLAEARSNREEYTNGADIYEKLVKPAMVDLLNVGAHYAICSLFEAYEDRSRIYCYDVEREEHEVKQTGGAKLIVGRARITSRVTRETGAIVFGAANFGSYNVLGWVKPATTGEGYRQTAAIIIKAFTRADFAEVVRTVGREFEGAVYSLKQLFRDKQRGILAAILDATLADVTSDYQRIYDRHVPLMHFLTDLETPQPKALATAAEFVLDTDLREALGCDNLDRDYIESLITEARTLGIPLDGAGLDFVLVQTLSRMSQRLQEKPQDIALIRCLDNAVALARALPFEVGLWQVQNVYFGLTKTVRHEVQKAADEGDEDAREWLDVFCLLGEKLRIKCIQP